MKSITEWLDELKDRNFPVLRQTIAELGKLAGRAEHVKASQIADAVLRDPLMTLKVLHLVNGRSRSRLSNEITTVEHAIIMMGVGPFFNRFADLLAVEDALAPVEGALPELMRVLSRAHHAAWQARDWAIFRADMKSEEVYIGALLYDLGEIVLWSCAPDAGMQIQAHCRQHRVSHAEGEKALLGFELHELQLTLAEAWNLPELTCSFMHSEESAKPRILGVILAGLVARHAEWGWYGEQLPRDFEAISTMLHIEFGEAVALVHRNAVAAARHWEWYGRTTPAAAWLPMLPGEWPAAEGDAEGEKGGQGEAHDQCLMPRSDVLAQVTAEMAAHLDGTLNLHDMMSLVLKGLHQGIGLNRVVFALMSTDRRVLKAKYVMGAEAGSPLQQFQIDMTQPQLFNRLMEKMQSLWLSEGNRKALAPLISDSIWEMIGRGDFFVMSVFVNGNPIGLFYADRGHGKCELDDHSYQEFKKLCLRAAEALGHLSAK